MAFQSFIKKDTNAAKLNMSPMIDVTFLLIIYFIVSIQMEPSLDNIIKLPPIVHASEQKDALLQIYVLPASILAGGFINADSTGLVAFSDKAKPPELCPRCGARIKDKNGMYLPGSMVDGNKKPIVDLQKVMGQAFAGGVLPPAFNCANCGREISPYVQLDEIPALLKEKRKEVLDIMVSQRNAERLAQKKPPLSDAEIRQLEKEIPLMIKADNKAFYGRILQVVNMAKDTACDVRNFAFVTLASASQEAIERQKKIR